MSTNSAGSLYRRKHFRVGYMRAVPGQQEMHAVDCRDGDVGRVGSGFRRESQCNLQVNRQIRHLFCQVEQWDVPENLESFMRCLRIPSPSLIQDQLGDEEVETNAAGLPPLSGDLLMAGADRVPAWPRGEVARHSRLQVELRFHLRQYWLRSAGKAKRKNGGPLGTAVARD